MGDILNFNPDRRLEFDPGRTLEFAPGRPLEFDSGRPLDFNPNRDLGFGRRGVVFRGYICPICGALVSEDAAKCGECGTLFEGTPRAAPAAPGAGGPVKRPPSEAPQREAPKVPGKARAAALGKPPVAFCAFCGAKLHPGDAFCWNCGSRAVGQTEVTKLPPQKSASVTRDWRGPKEG